MTREEAIEVIKAYRDNLTNSTSNQLDGDIKAFNMAIQALSQEPCDDTASIRKDVLKCRVGKLVVYNVEWLKKHWQMEMDIVCGVKPCDDAISRDELLKAIDTWDKFGGDAYTKLVRFQDHYIPYIHYEDVIKCIKGMPPVTPSRHKGHWLRVTTVNPKEFCNRCSECGYEQFYAERYNYCPNCGCRMVEPQESEDKG